MHSLPRHFFVIVPAVLLRKVPIVQYEAKELDECLLRSVAEIGKSDDLKVLSLNFFMLFAFNDLKRFSQKLSVISFYPSVQKDFYQCRRLCCFFFSTVTKQRSLVRY